MCSYVDRDTRAYPRYGRIAEAAFRASAASERSSAAYMSEISDMRETYDTWHTADGCVKGTSPAAGTAGRVVPPVGEPWSVRGPTAAQPRWERWRWWRRS